MALKIRRGLEADRTSVTPEEGEFLYTTDEKKLYIGDGSTPGGNEISGGAAALDIVLGVGNDGGGIEIENIADPSAPQSAATKSYVDAIVTGLWDDRGNFDASVNAYPSSGGSGTAGAILKGDIWTISVAGTLPTGQVVEVGDTVRALINTPGNTQANWAIAQNNIGYVPENAANKDTDGTLAANSDVKYASQKATKTYADTKLAKSANLTSIDDTNIADNEIAIYDLTNKKIKTSDKVFSTDGTLAGNSDSNVPTEKAVKTYADTNATVAASVTEINAGTNNTKMATPLNLQTSTYGAAKNIFMNNNFI